MAEGLRVEGVRADGVRGEDVRGDGVGRAEAVSPADVVEAARALAVPGQRRVLGIVGAPGAGKSTVAEMIAAALGPRLAVCVPMDGFHLANQVLEALGRRQRKGAADTFDAAGYANLLERLSAQDRDSPEIVYAPEFRREIEEPVGSATPVAGDVPLVVTEGNYLLLDAGSWPRARACIDQVWFLDVDEDVRHERLIRRHEAFGKTPEEARRWALGSDEENARLILATAGRADRVIRLA